MKRQALVFLAAGAALLLSAGRAFAEEDLGVRFRYSLAFGGGAIIVPGVLTEVLLSPQAQAGVQFNNFLGLHAEGDIGVIFGELYTLYTGGALLAEFTFMDRILVGVGPEVARYDVADNFEEREPARSGIFYGGKLRFGWCLDSSVIDPPSQEFLATKRTKLILSLDVRLLGGGAGFTTGFHTPKTAPVNDLVLMPTLNLRAVLDT